MPGAINVPVLSLFFKDGKLTSSEDQILNTFSKLGIDKDKPIVVSCNSGV